VNRSPITIEASGGGFMLLRIVRDIGSHFPARVHEWITAFAVMAWGVIIALPFDAFAQSAAWSRMSRIASEDVWAAAAITVGALRIIALVINGTFWRTAYGRWSPHVRAAGCLLSSAVWASISIGLTDAPYWTTGLAMYPAAAMIDIANAWNAARDAGRMDGVRARELAA